MKQKCIILIDGSNFYYKLKDLRLHNLLTFNFGKFIKSVARSSEIVYACYYVGRIKQDGSIKAEKLFNSQQKLLGSLKKHKLLYQFGYLLKSESTLLKKEDLEQFITKS